MNDGCPLITEGDQAQKNDPDVSQASGDHQAGQTLGVINMTFVQMKTPAFLIGEKGFDAETQTIPIGCVNDILSGSPP